ncbi:hypothetical protein Efla_001745 [Eimeria flavescens]
MEGTATLACGTSAFCSLPADQKNPTALWTQTDRHRATDVESAAPLSHVVSSVAVQIENEDDAVLLVGNLDPRVNEEELYSALSKSKAIVKVSMPVRAGSLPAGYAIVELRSGKAARETASLCSKLEMWGRRAVAWVRSSPLCPQETHLKGSDTLLFDNLAFSTTEATLFKFALRAGTVVKTRLARDAQTSKSLGYGYVQMASPREAARAMILFRNPVIDSQPCRISSCFPPVHFI